MHRIGALYEVAIGARRMHDGQRRIAHAVEFVHRKRLKVMEAQAVVHIVELC